MKDASHLLGLLVILSLSFNKSNCEAQKQVTLFNFETERKNNPGSSAGKRYSRLDRIREIIRAKSNNIRYRMCYNCFEVYYQYTFCSSPFRISGGIWVWGLESLGKGHWILQVVISQMSPHIDWQRMIIKRINTPSPNEKPYNFFLRGDVFYHTWAGLCLI